MQEQARIRKSVTAGINHNAHLRILITKYESETVSYLGVLSHHIDLEENQVPRVIRQCPNPDDTLGPTSGHHTSDFLATQAASERSVTR